MSRGSERPRYLTRVWNLTRVWTVSLALIASSCGAGDGAVIDTSATLETADTADTVTSTSETPAPLSTDTLDIESAEHITIANSGLAFAVGPVLAAFALDTFQDYGLDAEEIPFHGNSVNVVSAVVSGEADFGSLGISAAISAINAGADITILGALTRNSYQLGLRPDVIESLDVAHTAPVEDRILALRGLTIATAPVGSLNHTLTRALVSLVGLDPEADLTIVPTDQAALIAGVRQGLYDGGGWQTGVIEANFADGSALPWISIPSDQIGSFGSFLSGATITSVSMVENNPELVDRFVAAINEVSRIADDDEQRVMDALYTEWYAELDRKIFDLMWRSGSASFIPEGRISAEEFYEHVRLQAETEIDADYSDLSYERALHLTARS